MSACEARGCVRVCACKSHFRIVGVVRCALNASETRSAGRRTFDFSVNMLARTHMRAVSAILAKWNEEKNKQKN